MLSGSEEQLCHFLTQASLVTLDVCANLLRDSISYSEKGIKISTYVMELQWDSIPEGVESSENGVWHVISTE